MALLTDIVAGVADKPFDLVSLSLPTMSQAALSKAPVTSVFVKTLQVF